MDCVIDTLDSVAASYVSLWKPLVNSIKTVGSWLWNEQRS